MRHKRVLSVIISAILVMGTVMPASAAGGVLNVDISTRTAVLRVQVPTKMTAEVDQFDITQSGTQIVASEFDMVNLSEVDVRVDVRSTVTLGTGITLASGKSEAAGSSGSAAWLAVAAKSAENAYDDTATAGTIENKSNLTEQNTNVTTFSSSSKQAEQTFFLNKGSGEIVYNLAVPSGNKINVAHAQFYQLTELNLTDISALQDAVDLSDVYTLEASNAGQDGASVTKLAKGQKNVSYVSTNKYYKAADIPSSAVTDGNMYIYGSSRTEGGKAGFTYIGRLSDSKNTWTKDDIKTFHISYTITGITATKYDEMKDSCSYGYYRRFQDMTSVLAVSKDGIVRMMISPKDFDKLYLSNGNVSVEFTDTSKGIWKVSDTSMEHQLSDWWKNAVKGKTLTVTLILKDGRSYVVREDFPA